MAEFNTFFELIHGVPQAKALSQEQSFLLICGYETGYTWEGFVYDENQKWKQIEP